MTYYLGLRMDTKKDEALIKDIDRFVGNKKFTRSDRVKELMRLGQMLEARNVHISNETGRAMVEVRDAVQEPRTIPVKGAPAKFVGSSKPLVAPGVGTKEEPKKKGLFGKSWGV